MDEDLQVLCTSALHQIRHSQAELLWELLPAAAPMSCVYLEVPIVSTGSTDVGHWCSLCDTNGAQTPQFIYLFSQTHYFREGGLVQRTGSDHKTSQHCRSQGYHPMHENSLEGPRLLFSPLSITWAGSQWSRTANVCVPKWRHEESSHQSMASGTRDLSPGAQYRTDLLNAKLWCPSGVSLSLSCSGERVLQHCLGIINCLLSILLGNDRT